MKLSFLEFIASIVVTVLEPAMLNLIMISALDSLSNQTVHAHASVNIKLRGVTIVQWSCRKSALITKSSPSKLLSTAIMLIFLCLVTIYSYVTTLVSFQTLIPLHCYSCGRF